MGKRATSVALAAFFLLGDNNSIGSKCRYNHVVVAAESDLSAFDINTKNHEASLLLLNNETDIVDEQRDLAGETYKQLMTTYRKGGASNGHMFNLKAQNGKSIILRGMAINTYKVGPLKIEIYVKRGNYKGYEMNRNAWTLWASTTLPMATQRVFHHLNSREWLYHRMKCVLSISNVAMHTERVSCQRGR